MTNIARTAPEVTEVNNLLVALGKLDEAAETEAREELRSAWTHGIFDENEAINQAKRIRNRVGMLTAPKAARTDQRTGAAADVQEFEVPSGTYALDGSGANETVFYTVKWWGGEGKSRDGKRRASVYLQTGPDETRVDFRQGLAIIGRIKDAGPLEASQRYGREIGECGVCHSPLTNDVSRELGIGPVCRKKF
jgi:hypothetical protein